MVLGEWSVPRHADSVADTRHHVAVLASRVLGHVERGDDVELCAGELLANAVDHGGGDSMRVRVTTDLRVVRFEVYDTGRTPPDRVDGDPLRERGRGLLIVAALAYRWGLSHDRDGTTGWFEVIAP